jgi:hypothetical protein
MPEIQMPEIYPPETSNWPPNLAGAIKRNQKIFIKKKLLFYMYPANLQ